MLKAFEATTRRIIEQMGGQQVYDDHIAFLSSGKQVTASTPKIMKKITEQGKKIQDQVQKVVKKEDESEPAPVIKKPKIESTQDMKNALHDELYGNMAELKSPAEIE